MCAISVKSLDHRKLPYSKEASRKRCYNIRSQFATVDDLATRYLDACCTAATLSGYFRLYSIFERWCADNDRIAMPADGETLFDFFAHAERFYQPSTLLNAVSAILFYHRKAGIDFDAAPIRTIIRGQNRVAPPHKRAAALDIEALRAVVAALPPTLRGTRDRAILLIGFAAALRPSELVGLDIKVRTAESQGSIIFQQDGLRIQLHRSKTDMSGKGIAKLIVRNCNPCPIAALEAWLLESKISSGAVFRSMETDHAITDRRLPAEGVSRIVKRNVFAASVNSGLTLEDRLNRRKTVSGYSLRSGFVTSAVAAEVESEKIAMQAGWTTDRMVVRYVRVGCNGDDKITDQALGSKI